MTVAELIEHLEQFEDKAEVRFIAQPHWPFEYSIAGVTCPEFFESDEDLDMRVKVKTDYVLLVEGTQLGYGSKAAWDCVP